MEATQQIHPSAKIMKGVILNGLIIITINHITLGNPVKIYSPSEIKEVHTDLRNAGGLQKNI